MPADARPSDRRPPADLDDYEVDLDDIFGDITPPPGQEDEGTTKRKARENGGGADDDDGPVAKRARAPRVKLDEQRLLSDEGIPKLRARAKGLKFKGKSHEFSDTARLLDCYQLWLDDLFPKAKFLDALAMVEKTGHKTAVMSRRRDWIAEERRKELGTDGDNDDDAGREEQAKTPPAPRDFEREIDDIYTATPPRAANPSAGPVDANQDEDDADLEALMMEADDDLLKKTGGPPDEFAEDEAAMAEMEFAGWSSAPPTKPAPPPPDEYADDEAAMAEMGFP